MADRRRRPAPRPWSRAASAAVVLVLAAAGGTACTKDQGSTEAFCREVRLVPPLASVVSGYAEADPATLDQRLDEAAAAYRRLADAAPSDVRGDVRTMTDLVDAVLDAVRANDGDPDATAADLRAAMKRHEGAQAASLAVAAFARTHCDVELNPTVPPDETSRPAGTGSTTASTGGP